MDGEFLVDTNIVVAFLEGEKALQERFRAVELLVLCVPVLGELFYGAMKSDRVSVNLERLAGLYENISVVDSGQNTASIYGNLKATLVSIGRPIPENDL